MEHHQALKKLKRSLNGIGLLGVVITFSIIWFVGLQPRHAKTQKLIGQQKKLEQGLKNQQVLHEKYQDRLTELEQKQSIVTRLMSRVPPTARESDFMGLISEIARRTGITISNFRPQSNQIGTDIGTSQIRISGAGPYGNVVEFLNELRMSPRMNRIVRLDLSPLSDSRDRYALDLTLNLYFDIRPLQITSRAD